MKHLIVLVMLPLAGLAQRPVVTGEIVERDGLARSATFLEQGIPVAPMTDSEVQRLTLRRADGRPLPALIEPEAHDENGKVRWLRASALVSMPAYGRVPVRLEAGASGAPRLNLARTADSIVVETAPYRLVLRRPGRIELTAHGRKLLAGDWAVDLAGDARAIMWGLYLRRFVPVGIDLVEHTEHRALLVLKGYYSKNFRKQTRTEERGRRFDAELWLNVNALSPDIRFAWRITNLTGTKTWLERYALRLPLAEPASIAPASRADRVFIRLASGASIAVTADFIEDLGRGAGIALSEDSLAVLEGGLAVPPDGGYFSRQAPDVHRMFHNGMSRTFEGAIITDASEARAAETRAPVDLVLPAQYYSDVKVLPEAGDRVTFGEFPEKVRRSAEWLLRSQWRGTLWWGEWYREWDETRNMGTEEASNANSSLAPLYHYWRTGDGRFLHCAKRAAQYTWDVQLSKSEENQGRMFHTRRHLFDELDWIHPRYQRAKGALLTSHLVLNSVARAEVIRTIRSFHEHVFDSDGVPHDWNLRTHSREAAETGVDTSNFIEALVFCYRETGDRYFIENAVKMSRWTARRWKEHGGRAGDDWNWNLSQYALRGLVSLYEQTGDVLARDTAVDIAKATLANQSPDIDVIKDGMGGRKIDNVFFHAWITAKVAAFAPGGEDMLKSLYAIVRQDAAGQRYDGLFVLDHGIESGKRTRWTSVYDAKSLVAYLPVLAARMAAAGSHSALPRGEHRNGGQ